MDNEYAENAINYDDLKSTVILAINSQPALKLMLGLSGMYEQVINNLPDIVFILMRDEKGMQILANLGLLQHLDKLKHKN